MRDIREARRSGRNPQRAQRPIQFRECIRRVLCAHWRGSKRGTGSVAARITYCESCGPEIEPRRYLGVFVQADCTGWRMQVKIRVRVHRRNLNARRHVNVEAATAQGYSAIDNSAPDRYGLRERIGEAFTRARRIYENESGTRGTGFKFSFLFYFLEER